MDKNNFFRKLSSVAKFDFKRFGADAEKIKIRKPQAEPVLQKNPTLKSNKSDEKLTKSQIKKKKKRDELKHTSKIHSDDMPKKEAEKTKPKPASDEQSITNGGGVKLNKKQKRRRKLKEQKIASKSKEEIAQMLEEKNRIFRKKHRIRVYGTDVPSPLKTFSQLLSDYGVKEEILHNVQEEGYDEPTPIQRQIIPAMLQGRDVMACAPTGSGKTAAFMVPVLHHLGQPSDEGFRACILAPTRELALQILRECNKLSNGLGLRANYIQDEGDAKKKFDILITTPNRLIYMLQSKPPAISVQHVEWLIVDESDKLFEAGTRGFRNQLGAIYTACSSSKLHRGMFSATFAQVVDEWCKLNLDNVIHVDVGQRNTATSSVEQKLVYTGDEAGKLIAFRNLIHEGISPPVLVFVQSKERAQHLYTELKYDNINVDVIHSDRSLAERDDVIKSFRLGNTWVLICTELMCRGIDFKGVNMVINYDFPTSSISYIHRVGRTGRAGRQGKAVTFFTHVDKVILRRIATVVRQAGCHVSEYMIKGLGPDDKRRKVRFTPKRGKILTMDPRDYSRLRRKTTDPRDRIKRKPADSTDKTTKAKPSFSKGNPKKRQTNGKGELKQKTVNSKQQLKQKVVDSKQQLKGKKVQSKKPQIKTLAETKKQQNGKTFTSKRQLKGKELHKRKSTDQNKPPKGKTMDPKSPTNRKRKLVAADSKPKAKRQRKS